MSDLLTGERVGGFLLFVDQDGLRHAVRVNTVLALSDGDTGQDTTVLVLSGGRAVVVQLPLDKALSWFQ